MTGARVTALGRRAKYGLVETDLGDTMVFHLGMSGRWRIDPAELGTHDHLVLETEEGDPRDRSSHQFKYYAPGVGNVEVGFAGGGDQEQLKLVSVTRLSAGQRAAVDRSVLAIDRRGYRVSRRVYGQTAPARP